MRSFFLRSAVDFVLFLFFSWPRSETSFFLATASIRSPTLFLFDFVLFYFCFFSVGFLSFGFVWIRRRSIERSAIVFFLYFYFISFFLGLTLFVVSNFAPPIHRRQKKKNKCVPVVVAGWISRLLGFTEFLCFRFGWVGFGLARAWSYRVRFRVHWILPSFTGFYCVLLRFNRVLLSF